MTGPEHYREAEQLLAVAADIALDREPVSAAVALAQVHATLALTAATALNPGMAPGDWLEWIRTAATIAKPQGAASG